MKTFKFTRVSDRRKFMISAEDYVAAIDDFLELLNAKDTDILEDLGWNFGGEFLTPLKSRNIQDK